MRISLDEIGLRNKVDQASTGHNYLDTYQPLLALTQPRTLAMILGSRPTRVANTFAEFLPDTIITAVGLTTEAHPVELLPNVEYHDAQSIDDIGQTLSTRAPYDIIIEDGQNRKSQKRDLFSLFFPLVNDGGLYIAEDLHACYIPKLMDDDGEDLWDVVSKMLRLKGSKGTHPAHASQAEKNLAECVTSVTFEGKFLVIKRSGQGQVKVKHAQVNSVLTSRFGAEWGKVLKTLPAESFQVETLKTANNWDIAKKKFPGTINTPEIYVREYRDVRVQPRQIITKDGLILPDTFRLGLQDDLKSSAVHNFNRYTASVPDFNQPAARLKGQFYHLDLEYTRHFGHFMTEAIPRLYAWDEAKSANPDLKILTSCAGRDGRPHMYQRALLNAYGIKDEDMHVFSEPVQVESLISAMPLFHNMKYAHPLLRETYERISDALYIEDGGPRIERFFVSRTSGMWRECLNMDTVENVFRASGFEIVYPEKMSIPEQATLFRNAKVAAGYIGSAMYSAMFATTPIDMIGLTNTSYVANNEYLINSTMGHRMHNFWSADVKGNRKTDSKGRPVSRTNYDYWFDFASDGDLLASVIGSV